MIRLNAEWTQVLRRYKDDHQDRRNQVCHQIGIPLIVASFPVGATLIGLPLAAAMFTTGWGFQFAGHWFEGKKPSFVDDKRSLIIGVLWCLEKYGLRVFEETPAA
ncbi:Mpo1-like protein [Sorangium sp. So ce131]|uniref:Mpo1-like protein n=1 Tax=Sorangium sp. So ce131 TaxID=3133282 RepID=UPI003F60FCAA